MTMYSACTLFVDAFEFQASTLGVGILRTVLALHTKLENAYRIIRLADIQTPSWQLRLQLKNGSGRRLDLGCGQLLERHPPWLAGKSY